jgi:hypothetical protein
MTNRLFLVVGAGVVTAAIAAPAGCGGGRQYVSTTTTGSGGGASGTGGSSTVGSGGAASSSEAASSSSSSGGGGTGGGPTCTATDPCSACQFTSCTGLYCACQADADCAALAECVSGCAPGDQACQQACRSAHVDSISQGAILGDCAAKNCAADCPLAQPLNPCLACMFPSCPTEMNQCLADPECTAIIECAEPCMGDQICVFNCAQQHPNGTSAAQDVLSCLNQSCSVECN